MLFNPYRMNGAALVKQFRETEQRILDKANAYRNENMNKDFAKKARTILNQAKRTGTAKNIKDTIPTFEHLINFLEQAPVAGCNTTERS